MSNFQSYLIVAPTQQAARTKTQKIAKDLKIDIDKVSPDVFYIRAKKTEISIDQIRELKSHIHQKPLKYSHKFVVIENAHNITPEGQNALLKLLEEPPSHAIIVLEAKNKALLLPTILSRVVTRSDLGRTRFGLVTKTILDQSLESALETISAVENPQEFLDQQIISLTEQLINSASGRGATSAARGRSSTKIVSAIEKCKEAKEMITANVNPIFVLANLIFAINQHYTLL
ncbi:MAG TPA: hypothetical protein VLE91_00140 [Candidatus Saccharimonadales bacterium]|nr:hypothetical protein [Candidatus Saccharimonadales bacterium]